MKLYLIGKRKEYPFEKKKNISVVGNPWYFATKKLRKHILHKIFLKILKNVTQLENFVILGDKVVRISFHQYLSKKKRKSF